jgi:hypothetical protein
MKQLCPSYSIAGQAITLIGVNVPQDHILLISNATNGGVLYSLSSGTALSYTQGVNSVLTLISTVEISNSDELVIYYDDGVPSQNAPSSVSVSNFPATQPVSAASLPLPTGASTSALQTTGNSSLSTIATNTTPRNDSFAIPVYTSKGFVYTGSNITTINYYTGGSTLVAYRTLVYSGSNITSDTLTII